MPGGKIPAFETIDIAVDGPRADLTLNRPERLNAMGATMLCELVEAARWLNTDHDLRVVVVGGAGRAFCAGADLKDPPLADASPASGNSWSHRREVGQYGLRMADAVEAIRAVTIVRIHGHAVGGGVVLASACDLRVAADDTRFCIPEVALGIPLTWGGIPRLVRDIGPALTKELVMTCRPFDAAEAWRIGFLNRVVAADQLHASVDELTATLISMPSVPVTITKEHVNAVSRSMSMAAASFSDGEALLNAAGDPESRVAAEAYAERTFGQKKN